MFHLNLRPSRSTGRGASQQTVILDCYSHPTPSPSRSRCRPYPGSPRRTGAAPAARAAEQFAKEAPPPIRRCGFSAGADRVGDRWQCRPPFLRSLWQPSAARPPGWLCAAPGIPTTTSANEIAIVRIPVSPRETATIGRESRISPADTGRRKLAPQRTIRRQ